MTDLTYHNITNNHEGAGGKNDYPNDLNHEPSGNGKLTCYKVNNVSKTK